MTSVEIDDANGVNLDILKLLPADAKVVVEFGCGTGATGAQYKRINPHSLYIGVELNPELAKKAATRLDRVVTGDAEQVDATTLDISLGSVDCIVYGYVLPQFVAPLILLQRHASWLKEDGQVLAIAPNVQHWQQIVNLLRGNPVAVGSPRPELGTLAVAVGSPRPPRSVGLDPGQLQFFTLDSIKQLFAGAGLQVYEIQTQGRKGEGFQQFQQLMAPAIQALGIEPATFANQTGAKQYIVRATKSQIPPRRLLIQTIMMAPTGCDRVRVLEPDWFSATIPGVRTLATPKTADLNFALPGEEKVLIWQRTILNYPADIPKLKQLLRRGYLIAAEIDDDPLRRPEYEKNRFLSYRGCHCVQTSTEPLAAYLRQHNPNVAVFTNQLAYLPPARIYQDDDSVTLFFGALNREKDWQPIMQALNRAIASNKHRVGVKVIHDSRFFDALETQNKEFETFCSYERYQEILHTCDIALLPLLPNRVNSMKSELKFIECAGHGVVAIASPTVYEKFIVEGETGLIYRSVEEFETLLRSLLVNTQLRRRIAANAYLWVSENRLLSQHYRQRRDWYLQMRDDLPRLNLELRDRVPELFED